MEVVTRNLERWNQEIQHLYQAHVVKLEHINAQVEAWVQKLKALTDQAKIWTLPRLGLLRKEDAQDDECDIAMRKKPRLPKFRGKIVSCFLCYQYHFSIDFTLKEKLDNLEEFQVQLMVKKKLAALGVLTQVQ
jgi:hypothetical protein